MMTLVSPRGRSMPRLLMIAAGWAVTIATTLPPEPVETASVDVTLAVGPAAPSTAVIEVAVLGAFIGQRKFVCAFVSDGADPDGRLSDIGVTMEAVTLDPDVALVPRATSLTEVASGEITTWDLDACAELTCTQDPCGGRLAITLVDLGDPSATPPPDPGRLEPLALQLVVVVDAEPGALPGEASVTLVETQP